MKQNYPGNQGQYKRPKLQILLTEKGEENQNKCTKIFFKEILDENFPNLKKNIIVKEEECTEQQIDWTINKKNLLAHNNQSNTYTEQRKILKASKEKKQLTHKVRSINITPDFLMEILQSQ